jgi:DNA-binding MltR family transcriptional regulator
MASVSSKTSLKALLKRLPTGDEVRDVTFQLRELDDNAAALVACALLSHALRDAIISKFVPISEKDLDEIFSDNKGGPLASLSARIRLAHAMGIVGPRTRRDLDILRRIRNAMAHVIQTVDFSTKEVRDECDKIEFMRTDSGDQSISAKDKYVVTAALFTRNLQNIADQNRGVGIASLMIQKIVLP